MGSSQHATSAPTHQHAEVTDLAAGERAAEALQDVSEQDTSIFLDAADQLLESMDARQALARALVQLTGHSSLQVSPRHTADRDLQAAKQQAQCPLHCTPRIATSCKPVQGEHGRVAGVCQGPLRSSLGTAPCRSVLLTYPKIADSTQRTARVHLLCTYQRRDQLPESMGVCQALTRALVQLTGHSFLQGGSHNVVVAVALCDRSERALFQQCIQSGSDVVGHCCISPMSTVAC